MVGMRSFRVGEVDMFESHSPCCGIMVNASHLNMNANRVNGSSLSRVNSKDISYPFTVITGYPRGIVMKHCEIQSGIAICKTFIHR